MAFQISHANKKAVTFLVWQDLFQLIIAAVTLTVTPSTTVDVNQLVTLKCTLDPNPIPPVVMSIKINSKTHCSLEWSNGMCKNVINSCANRYNSTCHSETMYTVEIPIPKNWTGAVINCATLYYKSKQVVFDVKVPVALVTLTPTSITVIAGELMKLNCATSYCNPPANITWYMSPTDITNQSTSTINEDEGLARTVSSLLISFGKPDNGKKVYCNASNIPDKSVTSTVNNVIVKYKPEVTAITRSPYILTEKTTALLKCNVTAANPATGIKWKWFKIDNPKNPLHNESIYRIINIQREKSGVYNCTATNNVGTSDAAMVKVDVQYAPEVISNTTSPYIIKEKQTAKLDCTVAAANPNIDIKWRWYKTEKPSNALHNESTYTIVSIKKEMKGSYSCTATNSVGTSVAVTIQIDVHYKPEVKIITINPYKINEGHEAKLECTVIAAKPKTDIIWKWNRTTSAINPVYNGPTYIISNITKNESGSYSCTAANSAGISEPVMITVDVQYKPMIVGEKNIEVNESDRVVLTQGIDSNPLSNVSWYDGSKLLKTQVLMTTATYIIEKAVCTDSKNFTIVAANKADYNVTAMVELIVNCKPRSIKTNFTLGLSDTTGIEFSTTVIAHPKPLLQVKHENGTINNQMTERIIRNGTYKFTVHLSQAVVNSSDFGVYHLIMTNAFGKVTIFVNVIPQRKPTMPENIEIKCEETRARIQWTSAFNGGDPQTFTVIALNGQKSNIIPDKGENEIHATYVQNLQSSTTYVFYVSARNSHGFSLSNNISCTTLTESADNLPLIAGGAASGGIVLAIIVIVIVVLLRIFKKNEKQAGKSQRFKNEVAENEKADDDGLRDNILYISAGPKVDEKPEAAVYAAVNKKAPESNNNANVYAEVNKSRHIIAEGALYHDVKPKKGWFNKDVSGKKDGNPKQRKGKKQKTKQDVADVYENSEDIAMSSKSDNVYSNTGNNVQNKEERGYKNKDGLLYVEVQFDAKTEKENQTIHGENEKTDYATVEFPMAASTHGGSGNEKI